MTVRKPVAGGSLSRLRRVMHEGTVAAPRRRLPGFQRPS